MYFFIIIAGIYCYYNFLFIFIAGIYYYGDGDDAHFLLIKSKYGLGELLLISPVPVCPHAGSRVFSP